MSDYYFSLSTVKAYVSGTFVSHAVKRLMNMVALQGKMIETHIIIAMMHIDMLF